MSQTWREWLGERVAASTMHVELRRLDEIYDPPRNPWRMQQGRGSFGRDDGTFFDLVGIWVSTKVREVFTWVQAILQEVGEGYGVVLESEDGQFLVQAKEEPGNDPERGYVMLAPTVQTSWSNLEQKHGGKLPPRAGIINDNPTLVRKLIDGGKFILKYNRYGVVKVDANAVVVAPNERWFTLSELAEAYDEGMLNSHLCEALTGVLLKRVAELS